MSDDKLFGEGLPGTGGDFIDVNDVEGHMSTKKIDPKPPTATGGPGGHKQNIVGSDDDTEGHRHPGGGHLPTNAPEPDGIGGKGRTHTPELDGGDDVEGHRRAGGGHLPTNAPEPDGLGSRGRGHMPEVDGDDVEGHQRNGGLWKNAIPEDAGPSGISGKSTGGKPPVGYADENDVEGHMGGLTQRRPNAVPEGDGFVKRGPDEMPHGDR